MTERYGAAVRIDVLGIIGNAELAQQASPATRRPRSIR